ncbi:MAG: hypothetical protein GF329_06580 [Candidatus Lokiarchaeota archaeon]|nr:hypothetical protein [Candidatus Lokiarchaeota archaeon]
MKLDIKINEDAINQRISHKIKKLMSKSKIERSNPKIYFIYQLSVETIIFDCFSRAVNKLKEEDIFNFQTYRLLFFVCENILEKKFMDLYLYGNIYDAKGHFLMFAKNYYETLKNGINSETPSFYS